jgi:hypothetical protein
LQLSFQAGFPADSRAPSRSLNEKRINKKGAFQRLFYCHDFERFMRIPH